MDTITDDYDVQEQPTFELDDVEWNPRNQAAMLSRCFGSVRLEFMSNRVLKVETAKELRDNVRWVKACAIAISLDVRNHVDASLDYACLLKI